MKKCPSCKNIIDDDSEFCPHCSKKIPKNSSSNNKLIIIAVVVVLAVVGIAFAAGMFSSNDNSSSVEDNSNNQNTSDKVAPVESSSDDDSSSSSVYWASIKAEKFHKPNCEWAQKISEDNKIVYHSRDEAIQDGKVPCGACNP